MAQLLSYLKLSGCHIGLLINFNVKQLTMGIRRLVHELSSIISAISACSAVNTSPQFGPGELARQRFRALAVSPACGNRYRPTGHRNPGGLGYSLHPH